jgi:hypothetical protein
MVDRSEIEYWDHRDDTERLYHNGFDEAVEAALDDMLYGSPVDEWPTSITMYGYVRDKISDACVENLAKRILEETVRTLDEDYELGDPDGWLDCTKDERLMKIARAFARGVRKHYEVWRCTQVLSEEVNVMDWVTVNRPDWLENHKAIAEKDL